MRSVTGLGVEAFTTSFHPAHAHDRRNILQHWRTSASTTNLDVWEWQSDARELNADVVGSPVLNEADLAAAYPC